LIEPLLLIRHFAFHFFRRYFIDDAAIISLRLPIFSPLSIAGHYAAITLS